jgi:LacI family transcriptional regulator
VCYVDIRGSAPAHQQCNMSPTLEEIARLAQVSRSTVSRVINGHPAVDPQTRERVQRVVQEQNYHPNGAARALASRHSQLIGLVVPQMLSAVFSDPYFPMLIQGVSAACDERDYFMLLSFPVMRTPETLTRIVRGAHLDGLVVAASLTDNSQISQLAREGTHFVLVGRSTNEGAVTTVDVDNVRGAAIAVQHLVRLGFAAIATITGPLEMTAAVDRREGYLAALRGARLEPPEVYVQEGDWSEWSGSRAMEALLRLPERPEAVFAASDSMAIGALKVIRAAGLRVPDDIALVGFDDIPLASALETPLTTVRQPIYRLGHTAASVLLDQLQGIPDGEPDLAQGQRIVLGTELIVRESCGHAKRFARHTN